MLSHATTRDWLIPYADGMLAAEERRRIDGHLAGCASCAAELREVRELNLVLVALPPAPPVAFAPFWMKLQAKLPQRRVLRIPTFAGYRRMGMALALAAIAVVAVAGSAFAAPSALPDNPLYPVKQIEESVRLALTPANDRLTVQLQLAAERLREAQAMTANHKTLLAENSLRAFSVIVGDISASLENSADPSAATNALQRLRVELDAVEKANANRNGDSDQVKQLVLASIDNLDRIAKAEQAAATTPAVVDTQTQTTPTAQPTSDSQPTPPAKPRPTHDSEGDHSGHRN